MAWYVETIEDSIQNEAQLDEQLGAREGRERLQSYVARDASVDISPPQAPHRFLVGRRLTGVFRYLVQSSVERDGVEEWPKGCNPR